MRKRFEGVIKTLLYYMGVYALLVYMRRRKIVMFMAHGVVSPTNAYDWEPLQKRINAEDFENVLRLLLKRYRFVSMEEAVSILSGEKPSSYAAVLTFDDGYRNQLTTVVPILKKYGVPAIFYVTTSQVESRIPFWFDRVDYLLHSDQREALKSALAELGYELDDRSRPALADSFKEFRRQVKERAANKGNEVIEKIEEIASRIEGDAGVDIVQIFKGDTRGEVMDWADLRTLVEQGYGVGSHACDHLMLSGLSSTELEIQVLDSKRKIEHEVSAQCRDFCYPHGGVAGEVREAVMQAGYESAVTAEPGYNSRGCDLYALKRFTYPDRSNAPDIYHSLSGMGVFVEKTKEFFTGWLKK